MNDEKQYVATFKTSIQISHDEWKVINPSMLCDENTKLKDIEKFVKENNCKGSMEVRITELTHEGNK
jgi:hypothetical protein